MTGPAVCARSDMKGGEEMKFSDFFLPKIARSDPNVRITAVEGEENVELLKKVVENDSDPRVIEAAQKRIAALSESVA
jgi:hypothetical protein